MGYHIAAMLELTRAIIRGASRERGQTLAEYGLLLTVVSVAVIAPTVILMRTALAAAFTSAANCMSGGGC